jgi:hypothetical protein
MQDFSIKPIPNEFDDHLLDVIGNEFKFDHAKGIAEWIKNSADAYSTTLGAKDTEQHIVLRFKLTNPKRDSVFECIDFVGMTKADIDKAFKRWGDPKAAKKGTTQATYGGHGNGGKFYMRQMFHVSRFITYRGGRLNVFGFNVARQYGYARGCEERQMKLSEALEFAEINMLAIPKEIRERWAKGPSHVGFTVVRGEQPKAFHGRSTMDTILNRLKVHPQARRLLRMKPVSVVRYPEATGSRLAPPSVEPRNGFEKERVFPLPRFYDFEGERYEFKTRDFPKGRLTLRTSNEPLRAGELQWLNAIDIIGEVGCIGSYKMNELGFMRNSPEAEFVYGECLAPFLEDKSLDLVKNDREKLVDSPLSRALLNWICERVDSFADELAERRRNERREQDLERSSLFNQLLDKWKNQFMEKLHAEIFGGAGSGGTFGGTGGGGGPVGGKKGKGGDKGMGGDTGDNGGGTGNQPRPGPRFPRVLLSGRDVDPLDPKATVPFQCDERHPPVYQRAQDVPQGIYWINTSRTLARQLYDRYGAESPRFREYLFQRYVDIITKQSIHQLAKRDPDFNADKVDGLIDVVTSKVQDAAATDLQTYLFDEKITIASAKAVGEEDGDELSQGEEEDTLPGGEGEDQLEVAPEA